MYALACVLHECLTGRRPYSGEATAAVVHGHLHRAVPRPTQLRPDLPAGLDAVVARGMAKRPEDRYGHASALAASARAALTGTASITPVATPPQPWPADPPPPSRTREDPRPVPPAALPPPTRLAAPRPRAGQAPAAGPTSSARPVRRRRRALSIAGAATLAAVLVGAFALWPRDTGPVDPLPIEIGSVVRAVAVTEIDGRPVVVSAGADAITRTSYLDTGQPAGPDLSGHTDQVYAVAVAAVDGATTVVTGSDDNTARFSPLTGGDPTVVVTRHVQDVNAVATGHLAGPVAVTGSNDTAIGVWDLRDGRQIGLFPGVHRENVRAVRLAVINNRTEIVSAGNDDTVRRTDPATGEPIGEPYEGHGGWVRALAITELDGRTHIVSASYDGTVQVFDPMSGDPRSTLEIGGEVNAVAVAEVDGAQVVVSGAADGMVRLSDPSTGLLVAEPIVGHVGPVNSIATTVLDGRPVAVSGGDDGTVRIWDLAARVASHRSGGG